MTSWLEDLKAKHPAIADDIAIAGFGNKQIMANMVRALEMHSWLNTTADDARHDAAKRILAYRRRVGI